LRAAENASRNAAVSLTSAVAQPPDTSPECFVCRLTEDETKSAGSHVFYGKSSARASANPDTSQRFCYRAPRDPFDRWAIVAGGVATNPLWGRLQESMTWNRHCQEEAKPTTPALVPFAATTLVSSVSPDALGYLIAGV